MRTFRAIASGVAASAVVGSSFAAFGTAGAEVGGVPETINVEPPEDPREEQDVDVGGLRSEQAERDRECRPEVQHHLAAVAIAQSAEIQHGGGEPERVPDSDQVQLDLAGVEREADRGQRDVGNSQVQVCYGRNQDEREQCGRRVCRRSRGVGSSSGRSIRRLITYPQTALPGPPLGPRRLQEEERKDETACTCSGDN